MSRLGRIFIPLGLGLSSACGVVALALQPDKNAQNSATSQPTKLPPTSPAPNHPGYNPIPGCLNYAKSPSFIHEGITTSSGLIYPVEVFTTGGSLRIEQNPFVWNIYSGDIRMSLEHMQGIQQAFEDNKDYVPLFETTSPRIVIYVHEYQTIDRIQAAATKPRWEEFNLASTIQQAAFDVYLPPDYLNLRTTLPEEIAHVIQLAITFHEAMDTVGTSIDDLKQIYEKINDSYQYEPYAKAVRYLFLPDDIRLEMDKNLPYPNLVGDMLFYKTWTDLFPREKILAAGNNLATLVEMYPNEWNLWYNFVIQCTREMYLQNQGVEQERFARRVLQAQAEFQQEQQIQEDLRQLEELPKTTKNQRLKSQLRLEVRKAKIGSRFLEKEKARIIEKAKEDNRPLALREAEEIAIIDARTNGVPLQRDPQGNRTCSIEQVMTDMHWYGVNCRTMEREFNPREFLKQAYLGGLITYDEYKTALLGIN